MNSVFKIVFISLGLLLSISSCQKTDSIQLSCSQALLNEWKQVSTSAGAYCGDIFLFMLEAPREHLTFTANPIRVHENHWMDTDGFLEVDWSPNEQQSGYDAMYQVDCERNFLDIANLHNAQPNHGRCGPPPFTRFKIVKLTTDEMILESYSSAYQATELEDDFNLLSDEAVQQFVYHRL